MEENINSKITKPTNQPKGKVNQQQKYLKQLNINPVKPNSSPQKKFGQVLVNRVIFLVILQCPFAEEMLLRGNGMNSYLLNCFKFDSE